SGPRSRPIKQPWAHHLPYQAPARNGACSFKQWGGPTPKFGGRVLDGTVHDQIPNPVRRSA
ncbi:MAG: DUF5131 family protein, partial [Acidimicrobiia bacterium]|nr:DUF5131 family protein [Acidimicrobiia bacterium]